MPIDVKALKSAELFTDQSKIMELVERGDETYRKQQPLRHGADPGHTIVRLDAGRPQISKRSDVGLIDAAMPAVDDLKKMATDRGFQWQDGDESRVVRYWASDARGDRHGDVVDQSWDFDEYRDNPIMLFSHQWEEPPIGGILDEEVADRKTRNYDGEALSLLTLFAREDVSKNADSIFRLVNAGFLKAGSVGFFPDQVIEVKDKRERQTLGLADWGLLFKDNRLIEWSPCSVPANPGAHRSLAAAKSAGKLQGWDIQAIRELRRIELVSAGEEEDWGKNDAFYRAIWRNLFPDVQVPEHKDAEMPIFEPVREGIEMVALEDLMEAVTSMRQEVNERLTRIEERQVDIEYAQTQTGNVIREVARQQPVENDEPPTMSFLDAMSKELENKAG